MKNSKKQVSKLNLNKFQISKINNPQVIIGGQNGVRDDDDDDNTGFDTKRK